MRQHILCFMHSVAFQKAIIKTEQDKEYSDALITKTFKFVSDCLGSQISLDDDNKNTICSFIRIGYCFKVESGKLIPQFS